MLISAYDIGWHYLPNPQRLPAPPSLTIVDSGGYETALGYDFSMAYQYDYKPKRWTLKNLHRVLDSWPAHMDAVFVSYDTAESARSLRTQIDDAKRLFGRYPDQLHNFLIKPSRGAKGSVANMLGEIRAHAKSLAGFHVIGVAEKELGDGLLKRMQAVAELRRILREAALETPIQVFGALDPVTSPLYCLAGADIFDGLTWLRFGYQRQHCIYMQNYAFLNVGIDAHDDFVKSKMLSDNYAVLRELQLAMQSFATTGAFAHFGTHAERFKKAYDSLSAQLPGGM